MSTSDNSSVREIVRRSFALPANLKELLLEVNVKSSDEFKKYVYLSQEGQYIVGTNSSLRVKKQQINALHTLSTDDFLSGVYETELQKMPIETTLYTEGKVTSSAGTGSTVRMRKECAVEGDVSGLLQDMGASLLKSWTEHGMCVEILGGYTVSIAKVNGEEELLLLEVVKSTAADATNTSSIIDRMEVIFASLQSLLLPEVEDR